ncbi:hypothetical protein DVW12_17020 [Clostridium botulinum]|nr:hypothetical protein [Clostridium botulinum]
MFQTVDGNSIEPEYFIALAEGDKIRTAFDSIISEYERKYGEKSYDGTISICSLGSCKLSFDKYSESNYKKAQKYIIDNHYGNKWSAYYIDLGVVGYTVITVKKELLKSKPECKLKFVISTYKYFEKIQTNFNYSTKTEADEKALILTLEGGVEHIVSKEYVIANNSKSDCSRFYKYMMNCQVKCDTRVRMLELVGLEHLELMDLQVL